MIFNLLLLNLTD